VDKLECRGEAKVEVPERSFLHLLVISGEGTAEFADSSIALRKGTSVFVPAGSEAFSIKGNSSMIVTTIPDNKEDKSL
jgi:mannose-6-phosphate isomerase